MILKEMFSVVNSTIFLVYLQLFELVSSQFTTLGHVTAFHVHRRPTKTDCWRLVFVCDRVFLQIFEIAKKTYRKKFNGYIVFIVVINFCKNFSIAKIFPSRFPGIFTNTFQCKIIPVYSNCIW